MDSSFGHTGKVIAIVPVGALLMIIFMYTLSSTADDYLSPALEFLTEKLQLSESLAGVTLLALGNGAPDIFAAISAAGGDDGGGSGGTLLMINQLTGSTLFISTIVQVMTVGASVDKSIKVTPVFFIRDLIFYALMNLYIFAILVFVKQITMVIAIGFIVIYATYVIMVVCQSKMQEGIDETNEEVLASVAAIKEKMVAKIKLQRQDRVKFNNPREDKKLTLEEDAKME